MDYIDNKTSGSVCIRIKDYKNASINNDILFPYTYGTVGDGTRHTYSMIYNYLDRYPTHIDIQITPDFAGGGQIRVYRVYFIIYYIPM